MASDLLSEARALIQAGKMIEAQHRLEPFIEANPRHLAAWQLELETWPTLAGKIKVLELCLRYNPEAVEVQQALATLKARQGGRAP